MKPATHSQPLVWTRKTRDGFPVVDAVQRTEHIEDGNAMPNGTRTLTKTGVNFII